MVLREYYGDGFHMVTVFAGLFGVVSPQLVALVKVVDVGRDKMAAGDSSAILVRCIEGRGHREEDGVEQETEEQEQEEEQILVSQTVTEGRLEHDRAKRWSQKGGGKWRTGQAGQAGTGREGDRLL
jgi:hypothetical protein